MSIRIVAAVAALMVLIHVFLKRKDSRNRIYALKYGYMSLLFSFYPLVFFPIQGYQNMGTFKARIWAVMTIALIAYEVVTVVVSWIRCPGVAKSSFPGVIADIIKSPLDAVMLLYALSVTVSFVMAKDKLAALTGAYGWFTGLLFQYGIVAIYFSVSRFGRLDKRLINVILISAMIVFVIGIFHRFAVDPIGIYRLLGKEDYVRFLSTIGQATWYSSYLCVVFPLGLHVFLLATETGDKGLSGAFLVISAMTLVTQNSDTAYGAFFVVILCCLIFSVFGGVDDGGMLTRLGVAMVIMSAGIAVVGVLERAFADRFVQIDDLSMRIAQGMTPFFGIAAGCLIILFSRLRISVKRILVVALGLVLGALGAVLVWRNAFDAYFSLGRDWGNGRGLIWLRTMQMFSDQPFINKFFGIGPGMFYDRISSYTELILANAHNEWLTAVVEFGIVGGLIYLGIFVAAIVGTCRKAKCAGDAVVGVGLENYDYLVIAMTLAYIVHGFFNYQQCISTPMYFVLLAIGKYCRDENDAF